MTGVARGGGQGEGAKEVCEATGRAVGAWLEDGRGVRGDLPAPQQALDAVTLGPSLAEAPPAPVADALPASRPGAPRTRVHDQPVAFGPRPAGQRRCLEVDRGVVDARARLAGAPARAASLLMEERQVGAGARAAGGRHAGVLGAERVSHAGGSVAGRT